jgi:hypothetical protein
MPPRSSPARLLSVALLVLLPLTAPAGRADPVRWEKEVAAIAGRSPRTPGGVVFIGSSSIRMWRTLATDFPGIRPLNHGFGGSHLEDSVHYFDLLVRPFAPSVVVLYAGENDVAGGMTPERVQADFREFRRRLRETLPEARLVFLSLKPSPSRVAHLAAMARTNALIAADCAGDPLCRFVDVATPMLDDRGQPRAGLFLSDRLHLNAEGYALWTALVRPALGLPVPATTLP